MNARTFVVSIVFIAASACGSPGTDADLGTDQAVGKMSCPDLHAGCVTGETCEDGSFNRYICRGGIWDCYDPYYPGAPCWLHQDLGSTD